MDLQHRLARQLINIAVSKGMEDMPNDIRRSVRSLIDLGLFFAKSANQKWFFQTAKKVTANPRNPYHALIARMITDVDHDTIKKVGLNLGYSSLIYGAGKLKKKQEALGLALPWLLIFDISEAEHRFFRQLEHYVREGRELGIYSYILCPHQADDIPAICDIAGRFEACLFVLKTPSGLIDEQTARALGKTPNVLVSVQAAGTDFRLEGPAGAFRLLRRHRCLYGFHVYYNENTVTQLTAPEYIRSAVGSGNFFGAYIAEASVGEACRDAVHTFACRERGEEGQPLVALEWSRDLQNIGGKILSGAGHPKADLGERAYCEYIRAKDMLAGSLPELLLKMKPCPLP